MNELKPGPTPLAPVQIVCLIAAFLIGYVCHLPWYVTVACILLGTFIGGCFRKPAPKPEDSSAPKTPTAYWEDTAEPAARAPEAARRGTGMVFTIYGVFLGLLAAFFGFAMWRANPPGMIFLVCITGACSGICLLYGRRASKTSRLAQQEQQQADARALAQKLQQRGAAWNASELDR